jgi:hypothetical protein
MVGRTVWTVTGMEVGLPDISMGENLTIAVVVVNELVIPRLIVVEVERFVVLGTGSTRATLLGLEKGAERTPSTLVREGIGTVTVVEAIKEVMEREGAGAVGIAILPTSTGEEVGESKSSKTLEPG